LPSLINKSKKFSSEIPFGPFIIIGCILYIIFIEQYKNLLFG
jgi:leader peptidase (prepilin peptidase)/N-methyltransferase